MIPSESTVAVPSPSLNDSPRRRLTTTLQMHSRNNTTTNSSRCTAQSVTHSILAGYAAGVSGTLVGHPLDSAKVWLQTQSYQATSNTHANGNAAATGTSRGTAIHGSPLPPNSAARNMSTLAHIGNDKTRIASLFSWARVRRLYKGVSGPLVTVGFVQSVNFATYDATRRLLHQRQEQRDSMPLLPYLHHDPIPHVGIAAATAGAVLATFTSPLLILKTQQQVHGVSFRQAFQRSFYVATNRNGVQKFQLSRMFAGFGPHLLSETLGRGVYFCCYESLKRYGMQHWQSEDTAASPTMFTRMASAAASGVFCWAFIFPLDMVRCRVYAQANVRDQPTLSALDWAQRLYREQQSWRAFYRGFSVTVLRAGPVAAAVLPIYDLTFEALAKQSLAT
jgi:solute carrier family 25 carnitine/acylcarnitine transporter 20/29